MSKIRMGLIGYGRLGSVHAENINKSEYAELYAVCDTNSDALSEAKKLYENILTFDNLDDFLKAPFDGVVIASSTHLHVEHIKLAAQAGKHIFTEKPIGLTMSETDEALQDVVKAGVKFQIGFQRRWDPRYLEAKRIIDSGKIGTPVLFKAYGRDPNASNPDNWGLDKNGGLFLNAAIHDYDAARFLLEQEALEISANGAALVYTDLRKYQDIDTCATTILMSDDTMAITEWSRYASYGYDISAEVIGTDGVIQIGNEQDSGVTLRLRNEQSPKVIDVFRDSYAAEIDAFALAIKNDTTPTPGIEDARIALHLALLARQSFEESKVIKVTNPAKLD